MDMASQSRFHILLVDDSQLDRTLIAKLLKRASYNVTTVDSGAQALEFLGFKEDDDPGAPTSSSNNHQKSEVNCIITDYSMPGMTGYDLLKKIKVSSSLRNIPVAIMSSENVPSRITACLEEGAEDFFLKPVKESDLNKLKPHMVKHKLKNQELEKTEKPEFKEADFGKPEILSRQEQEQQEEVKGQEQKHQCGEHEEQEGDNQQKQEDQVVGKKWKTMTKEHN